MVVGVFNLAHSKSSGNDNANADPEIINDKRIKKINRCSYCTTSDNR